MLEFEVDSAFSSRQNDGFNFLCPRNFVNLGDVLEFKLDI